MSLKLKWKGPTLDPSGYGTANRDYVDALYRVGANIAVEPWNFDAHAPQFYGRQGELVQSLRSKNTKDCDVVVHHYVPNALEPNAESGKFNVAYNTWETDALPELWVKQMNNSMDLVLVPSHFNKRVYEASGVTIPVEVVPHCVDVSEFNNDEKIHIPGFENHYKFLSVFQWTERKNPIGLLKAYLTGFYNRNDVVLVLKTYGSNTSKEQREKIKQYIAKVKHDLKLDKLPPIFLLGDMLTRQQMVSLYNTCDCFVLPTRGEGFGLPFAEAMAANCQVVAPNQGGQLEILGPSLLTGAWLCDYQWTPVAHMPWIPNYNALMNWIEPDIIDFRNMMIDASEEKAPSNDLQPHEYIQNHFSHETIGNRFIEMIQKHMEA